MSASTKRQHRFYVIMYLVLLSMLSACGGGADGGSNATSSNNNSAGNSAAASYLKWSGNPNETIILDRSNQRFQVVAADRNVFATDLVKTLSDIKLDTNLNLMQSGKKVGFLGSLSNGTAVFMCDNGSQLAIVFSGNSYSVDCGTQTGTGTGNGSNGSDGFVTFAGNANTTVVLDKNNQQFQVLEKDRSVLNASKTRLNGLTVDSSGRLIQNGSQVGNVQLSKSVSNTDVAVFTCTNGNRLGISIASDGYSLDCGSTSGTGNNDGGNNSNGTGSNGSDGFVKFVGNANTTVVLDRNNQQFQVLEKDRSVLNASKIRLNGLIVDSSGRLVHNGSQVGTVQLSKSVSNTEIAVFTCTNGSRLAISIASDGYSLDCGSSGATGNNSGGNNSNGTGSNGSDGYVTFAGNANTTVVLDKNNQKFQVLEKDRSVLNASKTRLNGLIVDSSGRLIQNGTQVGIVQLSKSVSNTDVAVFTCANGNRMGISNASDGYSLDCGAVSGTGNNNGSGNSGNNSNSKDGQRGDQCIRTSRDASGSLILTNTCNVKIYYNYCNLSGYGVCNPSLNSWSPSGYTYGWGTTFINPGQSDTVYGSKGTTSFYWVCVSPASPFITGFNTTSIMASSVPYGICKL